MRQLILTGFIILCSIQLKCQRLELVSTSGDYFFSSNLSIAWSLGEPVTETYSANGLILTQGFQQVNNATNEISEQKSDRPFDLLINPNPVTNKVVIKLIGYRGVQLETYQVEVFSILGELIYKNSYKTDKIEVDLNTLKPGAYMIKVTTSKSALHSTKLIQKI